jgi:hypothetical protein
LLLNNTSGNAFLSLHTKRIESTRGGGTVEYDIGEINENRVRGNADAARTDGHARSPKRRYEAGGWATRSRVGAQLESHLARRQF